MCRYILVFLISLFLVGCYSTPPKDPVDGANKYCAELESFAAKNDYGKADELTKEYLNYYQDKDLTAFFLVLQDEFRTPKRRFLGIFISEADGSKYPNLMEFMRRFLAVSKAAEYGVEYTGSGAEQAELFCSILKDFAKDKSPKNIKKTRELMKQFVGRYVSRFNSDGSVCFDDYHYKECKEFCVSLRDHMTPVVYDYLTSAEMQSEELSNFQLMAINGLSAAKEDANK